MGHEQVIDTDKLASCQVLSIKRWTEQLFSFVIQRPAGFKFTAGQFARIGVLSDQVDGIAHEEFNPDLEDQIFRAYSVVSSPFEETLEFFSVTVPGGGFTSRLSQIKTGDYLLIDKQPFGFLTLARYQAPKPKDLWLVATGTGAAPFVSMLQTFEVWERYERIVFIYGARYGRDLVYFDQLEQLAEPFQEGFSGRFEKLASITRKETPGRAGVWNQRIDALFEQRVFQQQVGFEPDAQSHVMLCGNPDMITDVKKVLKSQGLVMNRRGEGNIAVENYW